MDIDVDGLYGRIKNGKGNIFNQDIHCPMIIRIMADPTKGTMSAFCVEAQIGESTFYYWVQQNKIFKECYEIGKMIAREAWETEGRELRHIVLKPGENSYRFEYWRMIGWSRYGVGKNSRIRLNLNADDTPVQQYSQLMKQASEGDFTAGEIKQLMEAVNVGLNAHQVHELQKQIDELKSDLVKMGNIENGHNSFTNQTIA